MSKEQTQTESSFSRSDRNLLIAIDSDKLEFGYKKADVPGKIHLVLSVYEVKLLSRAINKAVND